MQPRDSIANTNISNCYEITKNILLRLKAYGRPVSYYDFVKEVLYAPEVGYYTRAIASSGAPRVGYEPKTDFYTAASLNTKVFQKLILSASYFILPKNFPPAEVQFIEIGSEPVNSIIKEEKFSGFKSFKTIRIGEDLESFFGKSLLFSNELLDAQPFHRVRFEKGKWVELGVEVQKNNILLEKTLSVFSEKLEPWLKFLPQDKDIEEGYCIDMPTGSIELLKKVVQQPWTGSLLFLDYGKKWEELAYSIPQGTARGYYQHKQISNILLNPGLMDITCHVCWDWCEEVLKEYGFQEIHLQSQEAFFLKNASEAIQSIMNASIGKFSIEKQSLIELLHPAHMGQKFQVFWGARG